MIDVFVIAVLSALNCVWEGLMNIYPAMGALMFCFSRHNDNVFLR